MRNLALLGCRIVSLVGTRPWRRWLAVMATLGPWWIVAAALAQDPDSALAPPEITAAAYPTIAAIEMPLAQRLFQRQPEAFGAVVAANREAAEAQAAELLHLAAKAAEERQTPYVSLYAQALVALEAGRIEPAVDLLRRAVAQRRDFAEAWVLLGTAYWQRAQRSEAAAAFAQAIQWAPGLASARQGRALVLAAASRRGAALAELSEAVCANPYDPFVRRDLIRAAHRLGQLP